MEELSEFFQFRKELGGLLWGTPTPGGIRYLLSLLGDLLHEP